MPFVSSKARLIGAILLLCVMTGCGNSGIVGKWQMSGTSDAIVWEFFGNGAVLVGEVRGKYQFGDQGRIKIETPFATSIYQLNISGDRMTLHGASGSKLEFTRTKETRR